MIEAVIQEEAISEFGSQRFLFGSAMPRFLPAGALGMLLYSRIAVAAAAWPGRIYGYIFICPQRGLASARAAIERYSANPAFVGIKFLPGYHGPLACPEYDYALDFAAEAGCPVLCHIWGGQPSLADVERAVRSRPALKLMMAHQGGGSAVQTDNYVALMHDYANLYMETCGSLYNSYSMEDYVAMAGEERVIYGSDMINLDPRFDLGQVIFSTLDDRIKRKLLAGNFLRLLQGSRLGRIDIARSRPETPPAASH